jgi:Amt family ammonium transporter
MDFVPLLLTYLLPLGLMLIAWGTWDEDRLRDQAISALLIVVTTIMIYGVIGFGLQFGGVGLQASAPTGLRGLDRMWTPFSQGHWGFFGLEGFGLEADSTIPGDTNLLFTLFLHQLPIVVTATLLAGLTLAGRVRSGIIAFVVILLSGLIIPLAGAWTWGGGWLSTLGLDAQLGHGLIDLGGAASAFASAGFVTLAALVALRLNRSASPIESPLLQGSARIISGAVVLILGWLLWIVTNPIGRPITSIDLSQTLANILIGVAATTGVVLLAGWFITHKPNPALAARGVLGGLIVATPLASFAPAWASLISGAFGGLIIIAGTLIIERWLRYDDSLGTVAIGALAGSWALLAVGLFANGAYGAGWNQVGVDQYLGVPGQGVTGLIARSDLPGDSGQFTAQLVGIFALAALSFIVTWILLRPLRGLNDRARY